MKKMYYVVERQLESDGEFDYATDAKDVTLYVWDSNVNDLVYVGGSELAVEINVLEYLQKHFPDNEFKKL